MNWWYAVLDFFGGTNPKWIKKGTQLRSYPRKKPIEKIIIHESVTKSTATAVSILKKRKLGVHYCVDKNEEGAVTWHVPVERACSHAAGLNHDSIGIEICHEYYPKYAKDTDTVFSTVWSHKKSYFPPLEAQLKSLFSLILWLALYHNISLEFPGVREDGTFRWGRIPNSEERGIQAHARTAHADGLFPECYIYLRCRGFEHDEAWNKTIAAASAGQRETKLLSVELLA